MITNIIIVLIFTINIERSRGLARYLLYDDSQYCV